MPNRSLLREHYRAMLIAAVVVVLCCGGGALWVSSNGLPFMEPPEKGPGMWIRNDRPQPIKVRIVFPDNATITKRIPPGGIDGFASSVTCDATLIEATEENGYILGRLDSGGCVSRTWIIGADGTTRFVPGYAEH